MFAAMRSTNSKQLVTNGLSKKANNNNGNKTVATEETTWGSKLDMHRSLMNHSLGRGVLPSSVRPKVDEWDGRIINRFDSLVIGNYYNTDWSFAPPREAEPMPLSREALSSQVSMATLADEKDMWHDDASVQETLAEDSTDNDQLFDTRPLLSRWSLADPRPYTGEIVIRTPSVQFTPNVSPYLAPHDVIEVRTPTTEYTPAASSVANDEESNNEFDDNFDDSFFDGHSDNESGNGEPLFPNSSASGYGEYESEGFDPVTNYLDTLPPTPPPEHELSELFNQFNASSLMSSPRTQIDEYHDFLLPPPYIALDETIEDPVVNPMDEPLPEGVYSPYPGKIMPGFHPTERETCTPPWGYSKEDWSFTFNHDPTNAESKMKIFNIPTRRLRLASDGTFNGWSKSQSRGIIERFFEDRFAKWENRVPEEPEPYTMDYNY